MRGQEEARRFRDTLGLFHAAQRCIEALKDLEVGSLCPMQAFLKSRSQSAFL